MAVNQDPHTPHKLDITIESKCILQDAATQLAAMKAGSQLRLEPDTASGEVLCHCSQTGVAVAKLHGDMGRRAGAVGWTASIRSLKRDPQTGTVVSMQLRVTSGQRQGRGAGAQPSAPMYQGNQGHGVLDDDAYILKREQYEHVVGNESLQLALKDERLQQVLLKIDGAMNREQALDAALEGPDFRAFADQLLACISGEGRAAGPL